MFGGVAALAALILAAGCGDDGGMPTMDHGASKAPTTAASSSATSDFNDSDVMFAQMMIPHHQQAVEMADQATTRAKDPELKSLAAQIKTAQAPEISTMTGWLTAWGRPTAAPGASGGHDAHGSGMPGMMSEQDITMLTSATGTDFDRKFAEMMIAHHNGAITMAKTEQASGASPQAKEMAGQIEKSQAVEVKQLQGILDRLS
ncbi:DUF305 domain-containing protein [Micromonospora pisi]